MPFDVMYPDKAKEMKRMVLDYIKVLRRDHFSNPQLAGNNMDNGLQRNVLKIDPTGYPVAPRPQSWTKVTRADLEPIYRLYIARHYRMLHNFPRIIWTAIIKLFQSLNAETRTGRHHLKKLPLVHRNLLMPSTCRPAFR